MTSHSFPHRFRALALTSAALFALSAGACSSGSSAEPNPPQPNPPLGEAMDPTTVFFGAIAKSAGSQVGSELSGWLMGQLGIASTDPTLGELQTIESTLQSIDQQLSDISTQLGQILQATLVQTCQLLSSDLSGQLGHLDSLLTTYNTFVCTAYGTCPGGLPPANLPPSQLAAFADLVLNGGGAGSQLPVADILANIHQSLVSGPNGGILQACMATLAPPTPGAGDDSSYYEQVQQLTSYYYYYQAVGLLLYVEAQRYRVYELVGSPSYTQYPATDIRELCQQAGTLDPTGEATLRCNQANAQIQTVYQNLQRQFLLAGAPYADTGLVYRYDLTAPLLCVASLEDFSIAAGENCAEPLVSDAPCNTVLRAFYDSDSSAIAGVRFRNHGGWTFGTTADLATLMQGWSSGTAGAHLAALGFENMTGKVLLGDTTMSISFLWYYGRANRALATDPVSAVPFVDTDITFAAHPVSILNAGGLTHLPVPDQDMWASLYFTNMTDIGYYHGTFDGGAASPRLFQRFSALITNWPHIASWNGQPGWLATNRSDQARQFRLPVIHVADLPVATGRSAKNLAGVWTMHGDDFDAWFEAIVPAPTF